MDSASRHANKLANEFLEDLDSMQRASRAADRRAMSHFESRATPFSSSTEMSSFSSYPTRRRSWSQHNFLPHLSLHGGVGTRSGYGSRYRMLLGSCSLLPTPNAFLQAYLSPAPAVLVVGGRKPLYPSCQVSSATYAYPLYGHSGVWPGDVTSANNWLPTSHLKASPRPKMEHFISPNLYNGLKNGSDSIRRAFSTIELLVDTEDLEPSITRTYRRSHLLPPSRLGSVPPSRLGSVVCSGLPAVRPLVTGSRYSRYTPLSTGLPPVAPRNVRYYTTAPSDTIYSYSSYIRPVEVTSYPYGSYTVRSRPYSLHSSYLDLSPESLSERRRINRRLDDLLEYKLPSAEYYMNLKGSLRSIHDKMNSHRMLLDRYSGIDMNAASSSVSDRVDEKYRQLADRMPQLDGFRSRGPSLNTSNGESSLYYKSPNTIMGYGEGLVLPNGSSMSELRGRIKRILCRSKKDPHYYRYLPNGI